MALSYIPKMFDSKQALIAAYESRAFQTKSKLIRNSIMADMRMIRDFPDNMFNETFTRFHAAHAGELIVKLNMRSHAYSFARDAGDIPAVDATRYQEEFFAVMTRVVQLLQGGEIVFPCLVDLDKNKIYNYEALPA